MGSTEQILGVALGYLLATLFRYLNKKQFWRRVAKEAARTLADPTVPIDDPLAATEKALADAQHDKVAAVARTITDSQRIAIARMRSNLVDRPFEKRNRTPDTDPHDYHIGKGEDEER